MIAGDTIEAISCVREASRSMHTGLAMLYYVPPESAGRKEIDAAQQLMLRAQQRLKEALAKIHKTQASAVPASGDVR
jgi:hypothetical protein